MTLRQLLLGAAAVLVVTPAIAQYTQESTPAERAATQSLNSTAQTGIEGPPSAADQATYNAQQADYDAQMQQYRMQRDRYEAQRAHYDLQRRAYYDEISGNPWALPTVTVPAPDNARLVRLGLMDDPRLELTRAPLVDGAGNWVGRVRRVETSINGRPIRLQIYLYRDRRNVWVRVPDLRYDLINGVLYSQLTYRELRRLPGYSA